MAKRTRLLSVAGPLILTVVLLGGAAYSFSRERTADRVAPSPRPLSGEPAEAVRLTVTDSGIQRVTRAELEASGLPFEDFSPAGLSLTETGRPIPYAVVGQGEDEALYFFAQEIASTLEAPAVYWLAPGTGVEMARARLERPPSGQATSIALRGQKWEENAIFLAQARGDDVWLGHLLFAPDELDMRLDGIRPTGGGGELQVQLWSNNQTPRIDPDHHVVISLNGQRLADHYWEGIRQETIRVEVPAGVLRSDNNVLKIAAPGDTGAPGEAIYVDWVRLQYEGLLELEASEALPFIVTTRGPDAPAIAIGAAGPDSLLFAVDDPSSPQLLETTFSRNQLSFMPPPSHGHYIALHPEAAGRPTLSVKTARDPLRRAGRGADYVAVYAEADGFLETLQPLLTLRAGQGLSVEAVPLSQVFDEFGQGRGTPAAIRDFLAYAVAEWRPTPRYVLLVGDASYDVHDYTGGRNRDLLPTYLVHTEFAGYVASDTWLALLDEGSTAPGVAIGRFPVQNASQLATIVSKTLAYENAADRSWLSQALLVADDEAEFDLASDDLAAALLSAGITSEKLYMTRNAAIKENIIAAVDQGVGILNYVGHGSIEVWADERVFEAADAQLLANRDRLPIFTTFTCLNGYFNHPQVDALAETLLYAANGGSVAAIAPSGRSLTSQQLPLANDFFDLLLSGEASTLGEALQRAKIRGSDNDFLRDVVHTFNLLGDPALRFRLDDGQ